MPIPAQFNAPGYRGGTLLQQCDACMWLEMGHSREVIDHPRCGQRLGARKRFTLARANSMTWDSARFCGSTRAPDRSNRHNRLPCSGLFAAAWKSSTCWA